MNNEPQQTLIKGGATSVADLLPTETPRQLPQQQPLSEPYSEPYSEPFAQQPFAQSLLGPLSGPLSESFTKPDEQEDVSWKYILAVIVIFILLNNSLVYGFETRLLPYQFSKGTPPLVAVVVNAVIAGILFLLVYKLA